MKNKKSALQQGLQSINRGGGFRGLIQPTEEKASAAPQQSSVSDGGKRRGRKPNPDSASYSRMCAVVRKDLQAKLQEIASKHGLLFKEVLEEAMAKAVAAYEKKYGEIELPQEPQQSAKELF